MPAIIRSILGSSVTALLGRVLLTLPFWGSGLSKLVDFGGGVAEMRQFGLEPAVLFNVATIATQLGGSALVILKRWTWLGAGALGVFTALTIPIAHAFWRMQGERATFEFYVAIEHVAVIGGLVIVSILAAREQR